MVEQEAEGDKEDVEAPSRACGLTGSVVSESLVTLACHWMAQGLKTSQSLSPAVPVPVPDMGCHQDPKSFTSTSLALKGGARVLQPLADQHHGGGSPGIRPPCALRSPARPLLPLRFTSLLAPPTSSNQVDLTLTKTWPCSSTQNFTCSSFPIPRWLNSLRNSVSASLFLPGSQALPNPQFLFVL